MADGLESVLHSFCIVDCCGSLPMSGSYVTSSKRLFTRLWSNKTEIIKFTENRGLKQTL